MEISGQCLSTHLNCLDVLVKPEGKRKKGRPRMRWMDSVEKDMRNLGVVNWKTKAQERNGWRKFLEQAKTHVQL
jgi:hypothetical protein